jgi:4-amino-4-deoxy-L-arabinose transferase-like glycosyltransferase
LLFKAWLWLAGPSEYGARYLSAVASTLAIPLLAGVAYRLFRHGVTALVAAGLAAVSPYYVWYGQDAKMYPLYAALALGAQYCLLRGWHGPGRPPARSAGLQAIGSGQWSVEDEGHGAPSRPSLPTLHSSRFALHALWWAGYVACASLALYVHLFAALQIAANTAAGLWLWRRYPSGRRGFAGATSLLVVPYLPLALWQAPLMLQGANVGYQPAGLRSMIVALLEQFTWHVNPPPARWWLAPLALAAGWGLWRSVAGRAAGGAGTAAILLTWLVVPVAITSLVQSSVPVFRDRYLIPLVAPLLILLARAAASSTGVAGLAAAGFVGGSCVYGLLHRPPNPDFRAAARMVRETAAPGELVGFLAGYAERPFAFYYRQGAGRYEHVALPYTNYPGMTEQDGLLAVARSLRPGRWLWVVRFEDWLWDGRDLAGQYLANRGARVVLRRDLNGVSVTRYELLP